MGLFSCITFDICAHLSLFHCSLVSHFYFPFIWVLCWSHRQRAFYLMEQNNRQKNASMPSERVFCQCFGNVVDRWYEAFTDSYFPIFASLSYTFYFGCILSHIHCNLRCCVWKHKCLQYLIQILSCWLHIMNSRWASWMDTAAESPELMLEKKKWGWRRRGIFRREN